MATGETYATADLSDEHFQSPSRLSVATPNYFKDFGTRKAFHGKIETVRCFESNPMVKKTLGEAGEGRVLVVDGGESTRVAICGDMLARMASDNNWSGVIINGCIRDSSVINTLDIGVKAIGTHPVKSLKDNMGERGVKVAFSGVEFVPGHWVYADEDGVIVSEKELTLSSKL